MNAQTQIREYLATQPTRKRDELQTLHDMMLRVLPGGRLWFMDGRDEDGRTVSNPSIGYGVQTMTYADGRTRSSTRSG